MKTFILTHKKLILIAVGVILYTSLVGYFFSRFFLQVPFTVKFRCFVCERYPSKEKEEKPQIEVVKGQISAKQEQVETENDPLENIYQLTRQFESGKGDNPTPEATHNYCKSIGKVNEIGYFPNGDRKFCFEDEADQKLTFFKWMEKQIDLGHNLNEAICYYVTGIYQPTCKRVLDMNL